MNRMKIGTRLTMGFDLVLLLTAVLVAVGALRLTSIDESVTGLIEKDWGKADAANTINAKRLVGGGSDGDWTAFG